MSKYLNNDTISIASTRQKVIQLFFAVIGVFITVFGIVMFNRYLLMELSLGLRMVLMIISQWSIMIVPLLVIKANKENISDYFRTKERLVKQVRTGLLLGLAMSLFLTIVPILLGLKDMVGTSSYTKPWQFIYEFIYMIFGVALAEEFVFRSYIFHKLLEIKDSRWFAILVSSLLFGLLHIFNGDLIQVFVTGLLGVLFCTFREKIKGCSLLSLIIAHGLHNGLITLWVTYL